jgi:hypothetical protein
MRATVLLGIFLLFFPSLSLALGSLGRDSDPVVITGNEVSALTGMPITQIVGFRFDGDWQQIPIQIDEKKWVDFLAVYNNQKYQFMGSMVPGHGIMAYADSNTYVGPDTDPTFDSDDELVFMAKDCGRRALGFALVPPGVYEQNSIEIEVYDSLEDKKGYVYLFETDGALPLDVECDYVSYNFNLLSGSYRPNYNLAAGPNPENTEVITPYYRTHFSDRWVTDELNIYAGSSTGVDILDRHKNLFSPDYCGRHEDTFSDGEGAFLTNKDGPIRAIRSYMGANSGPATHRDHFFYEKRQDINVFLRVHSIQSIMDVYDYSSAATGMYYYNDLNPGGVVIDGSYDSIVTGPVAWEMVTGSQGTTVFSHSIVTNISSTTDTSYYSDDSTPSVPQCTGDDCEYSTSGLWVQGGIPNTDPYLDGPCYIRQSSRIIYYEEPNQPISLAQHRDSQAQHPLQVTVHNYKPSPTDFDNNSSINLIDFTHFTLNWSTENCEEPDWCNHSDLNYSGDVDIEDFQILIEYWLNAGTTGTSQPCICD